MGRQFVCVWLVALCVWLATAVPRVPSGELRLFAPASYDVETTVLLNDVTRKDKEIGYKIKATLDMAPVWSHQQTEFLLRFQLRSPKLYLRGKHVLADFMPYDSVWDSHADSTFYAHWKNGLIEATYLDPNELVDVVNYKKSLASLFQFQVLDGEYNETDVSGPCTVLYETVSMNVFRKIKRSCSADSSEAVSGSRRVARYTLSAALDSLDALYADELVTLGDAGLGLKARAWSRLARREAPAAPASPAPPPADAAAALRSVPAALRPQSLELAPAPAGGDEEELDDEELVDALASMDAALEDAGAEPEDAGAEPEDPGAEPEDAGAEPQDAGAAAATLLRVLGTLRAASGERVSALLARADMHPHLSALCRALGLAGSRAAHAALARWAALGARDPLLPMARDYLDALALALRPDEWVVLEVLRLGEEARSQDVAERALLSAAAAAARLERARGPPAAAALAQNVRDTLARSLARCKEERCRAVRLQALGNLRRADTADLLLEHAARGAVGEARAALAALDALDAVPPAALTFARLDRLSALALDPRAPLEVAAAALDLLVRRRAPVPAPLAGVVHALYERGAGATAHELRRVLWQRLAALAPQHDELGRLPAMLEPVLRGWDAQAHSGTSTVLVRPTGWAGAGRSGELESVQVARAGLLRRGGVTLRAVAPGADDAHVLSVHVWTRGLEAFGGGAEAPGDAGADAAPAEEAAGGLALTVAGARMRDVSLFEGQAELLGHVWAGTASAPTAVLRALRPLAEARASLPLQGGARLAVRHGAALALALDARAQVSLWYRSARAGLALRAGAAAATHAALRPAWGRLAASARARAAPRLAVGADLDFYSRVALCVRARAPAAVWRRRVELAAEQGARRLRVERRRADALRTEGRTLALGRANDATCRTLLAADDDPPGA